MKKVIKKSISKTKEVRSGDLVDNWITSFKLVIRKPYLFIPDLIYIISFYLIATLLAHHSGALNILRDMIIYGPQHFTQEGLLDFFKSNSFKLIYSLITFVIVNFIIGVSLFAFKYHMIANLVSGKRNKNLWKQFLLSKKKIIKLVFLKIYTYLILVVLVSVLILIMALIHKYLFTLPTQVIGLIFIIFIFFFLMFTLFSIASLFIENRKPLPSLLRSFRFAKKKPIFTILLILIIITTYVLLTFIGSIITIPFQMFPAGVYAISAFIITRTMNLILKVFKTIYIFKNFKH